MKRIIDIMKNYIIRELENGKLELLDVEVISKKAKDSDTDEKFFKFGCEIPRGHGELSRMRLDVKVPVKELTINPEEYEGKDFFIVFQNLEISYIDERGNTYFRAENFNIIEEV